MNILEILFNFENFKRLCPMGSILLKNIYLEGTARNILLEGNRISRIVPADVRVEVAEGAEIVDCTGKAVLPGLVNMHTHAGMAMMRGVGEDIVFHDWLDRIWQVESYIDDEYVYHATKLACLEMIKTGTTTFNEHYWHMPMGYKAAMEMGLRSALAYVICDRNDPQEAERQKVQCAQMLEFARQWGTMTQFVIAIHAIYSVSEPLMSWAVDFARRNGLKIHIHVSETEKEVEDCKAQHGGMSPVEYLDSLGVLGPDVMAAHTLWVSDDDIRILGERGVTCVHNVNSNLKLASGYRFRYSELRDAGANVCLGTDGCASSNNLDMLETMKTSAMVQKAWRNDPTAWPLDELLASATSNAGKALGLEIGKVEEGWLADLVIIDTDNYHFISPGTFLANMIYSAHSDCVDSVICDGKFVMRNRIVSGEKEILRQARAAMEELMNK